MAALRRTPTVIVASLLLPVLAHAAPPRGEKPRRASAARCDTPPCEAVRHYELELAKGTRVRVDEDPNEAARTARRGAIARDGTRIAFASSADLLHDGSNADGNFEIFVLDTALGSLDQITKSDGGAGSVAPRISEAGTRVVFVSDRDLLGDGSNPEGEVQVFLYDALTGGLAQLTRVDGGLASFAGGVELELDGAGLRAVFASDRDLLGDGSNEDENLEVFLLDTTTGGLTQLTDTRGGEGCFAPSIDRAGARVRWRSDLELKPEHPKAAQPKTARRAKR